MVNIKNLFDNSNIKMLEQKGSFSVLEHQSDLSVNPLFSSYAYFMQKMNVKKRQVLCSLKGNSVKIQAGAMQWVAGNVTMTSGIKGVGGLLGNIVKGAMSGESAVKPEYSGNGFVMLEPTYKYLLCEDLSSWGTGLVLDDGLFLACESNVKEKIVSRKNVSSALLGGEGLFNLCLSGSGVCVLESPVPRAELIEFELENDEVKIDGNMAIAWSSSLDFTVEKAGKTLIGSGLSGEGFVNVYRGTGKILMAPTIPGTTASNAYGPEQTSANSSKGIAESLKNSIFNA